MTPNNNGESHIETLKNRIDETVSQKDRAVKEMDKSISCLEKEIKNLDADIKLLEHNLQEMKRSRENVEIGCFKKIMQYHKGLLRYQNGNNGGDENR